MFKESNRLIPASNEPITSLQPETHVDVANFNFVVQRRIFHYRPIPVEDELELLSLVEYTQVHFPKLCEAHAVFAETKSSQRVNDLVSGHERKCENSLFW